MKLKKIAPIILSLVTLTGISGIKANAAEKTEDGVTLSISTDKTDYDEFDDIKAVITFDNNSGGDITDITLEGAIPANYHLSDNSKAVMRSTYIMSGNSISSEIVFISDRKGNEKAPEKETKAVTETTVSKQTETTAAISETVKETTVASVKNGVKKDDDGSRLAMKAVIAAAAVLAAAGAVILFKKSKGKTMMIIVCLTTAGAFCGSIDAEAVEQDEKTMSVSQTVVIGREKTELTAKVRYTVAQSDMQAAAAEYYEENSEEVIAIESAEETEQIFTEKEALTLMAERGFTSYPLTYDYDMDGNYMDEKEASPDSDEKHPMYQTYFVGENASIWSIFIVGRTIIANPVSYNLESDLNAQTLVSESDSLTSYTEMGNKFYHTIPKDSAVILKVVDQITSQKLNELTFEEVISQ